MKRLIVLLVLACTVCVMLCACQPKEEITAEEAVQIVMDDLGETAADAGPPHVHEGTYDGNPCYNIYITAGDLPFEYVVSIYGDILHKGFGSHSH